MRKKSFFAPILCLPFVACGSSDGGGHITVPDSHLGSGSGSGSGSAAPCTADASYGSADFGSGSDQYAEYDGSGSGEFEEWIGALNDDADLIQLELYAKSGGFPGNIMPGTYPIMGADTNYMTCGICVRMLTDTTQTAYADDYLASAGTVTLTSVSGSSFSGSFANLKMDHVTIGSAADMFLSTVVGDCTSTLTSGSFSTDLTMGSGSAAVAITHVHWTNPGTLARRHR